MFTVRGSMVDLQALVYVSSAVAPLSDEQIAHLLQRAQWRNAREQVTGVLLYSDGAFMQYLEGPTAGLTEVYGAICDDPLHHGIIEILREPVAVREFDHWAMGFRSSAQPEALLPAEADVTLARLLSPGPVPMSAGRMLLAKFWQRARGTSWR